MQIPDRKIWKQDLARYLEVDRRRSLAQIASVVVPYLAVWVLAAFVRPGPAVAIALGLVATVFLVRMYSLFHDLTHNSLFESLRLKLWDEQRGGLVRYPARKARTTARPGVPVLHARGAGGRRVSAQSDRTLHDAARLDPA
jgi:hypothetical protein